MSMHLSAGHDVVAPAAERSISQVLAPNSGWIFSKRLDLLLFGLPVVITAVALGFDRAIGLESPKVQPSLVFLVLATLAAAVDLGHVFSTVLRSYAAPDIRRLHGTLLYTIPLVILVLNLSLNAFLGPEYVLYLWLYLQFFHIMRQQWGWTALSSRKAGETSLFDKRADEWAVYALYLMPLIWHHALHPTGTMLQGLKGHADVAEAARGLFLVTLVAYAGVQLQKIRLKMPLNVPKLLIVAATAFVWGGSMFLDSSYWIVMALLYHGIPYLGIVYVTAREKSEAKHRKIWEHPFTVLAFGLLVLLFGYAWLQVIAQIARAPASPGGFPWVCLVTLPPLLHYIIDGVIWRRRSPRSTHTAVAA